MDTNNKKIANNIAPLPSTPTKKHNSSNQISSPSTPPKFNKSPSKFSSLITKVPKSEEKIKIARNAGDLTESLGIHTGIANAVGRPGWTSDRRTELALIHKESAIHIEQLVSNIKKLQVAHSEDESEYVTEIKERDEAIEEMNKYLKRTEERINELSEENERLGESISEIEKKRKEHEMRNKELENKQKELEQRNQEMAIKQKVFEQRIIQVEEENRRYKQFSEVISGAFNLISKN